MELATGCVLYNLFTCEIIVGTISHFLHDSSNIHRLTLTDDADVGVLGKCH